MYQKCVPLLEEQRGIVYLLYLAMIFFVFLQQFVFIYEVLGVASDVGRACSRNVSATLVPRLWFNCQHSLLKFL